MKPERANQFFMFPEFIAALARLLGDGVSVERFVYEPNSVVAFGMEFEVRVLSINGRKLPTLRRKDIKESKGASRPRRSARRPG